MTELSMRCSVCGNLAVDLAQPHEKEIERTACVSCGSAGRVEEDGDTAWWVSRSKAELAYANLSDETALAIKQYGSVPNALANLTHWGSAKEIVREYYAAALPALAQIAMEMCRSHFPGLDFASKREADEAVTKSGGSLYRAPVNMAPKDPVPRMDYSEIVDESDGDAYSDGRSRKTGQRIATPAEVAANQIVHLSAVSRLHIIQAREAYKSQDWSGCLFHAGMVMRSQLLPTLRKAPELALLPPPFVPQTQKVVCQWSRLSGRYFILLFGPGPRYRQYARESVIDGVLRQVRTLSAERKVPFTTRLGRVVNQIESDIELEVEPGVTVIHGPMNQYNGRIEEIYKDPGLLWEELADRWRIPLKILKVCLQYGFPADAAALERAQERANG